MTSRILAVALLTLALPGLPLAGGEAAGEAIEGTAPGGAEGGESLPMLPGSAGAITVPFEMPVDGIASVSLYNAEGAVVRPLAQLVELAKGRHGIRWDGMDHWGRFVPEGTELEVRVVANPGIRAYYEMAVDRHGGATAWGSHTGEGDERRQGGWLGDHSAPSTVAAIGDRVFIGCPLAEHGDNLIMCTLDGEKMRGRKLAGWAGPREMAAAGNCVYTTDRSGGLFRVDPDGFHVSGFGSVINGKALALAGHGDTTYVYARNPAKALSPFRHSGASIDFLRTIPEIKGGAAPTEFHLPAHAAARQTFTAGGRPEIGVKTRVGDLFAYLVLRFRNPTTLGSLLLERTGGERMDVWYLDEGVEYEEDLHRLDELLPAGVRAVEARATPIPSIAIRAKQLAAEHPGMVRADIGQIAGVDPEKEVLYGPPVGLPELRSALAETYNLAHGLSGEAALGAESVCVTTGAAEGLSVLFRCFAAGRRVGLPRGHWSNYLNGVELAGGEPVVLDFFDREGALDLAGLRAGILGEGLEVLVANFPCNPTGAVLAREEAAALAALAEELGILIIADEVSDRLRYDGHPPLSLLPFAPRHVAVVSSASKEYLLPGARVGWVLAAETRLTDQVLRKVVRASTASPNVLGQQELLERLGPDLEDLRAGRDPAFLTGVREAMRQRKDQLVATLERHGFTRVGRPAHEPQGTIFLMAGLPPWWRGDDEGFVDAALDAVAVSTVPGSAFGLPGAVRFSYGGMTLEAIERLDANLASLREAQGG